MANPQKKRSSIRFRERVEQGRQNDPWYGMPPWQRRHAEATGEGPPRRFGDGVELHGRGGGSSPPYMPSPTPPGQRPPANGGTGDAADFWGELGARLTGGDGDGPDAANQEMRESVREALRILGEAGNGEMVDTDAIIAQNMASERASNREQMREMSERLARSGGGGNPWMMGALSQRLAAGSQGRVAAQRQSLEMQKAQMRQARDTQLAMAAAQILGNYRPIYDPNDQSDLALRLIGMGGEASQAPPITFV